MSDHIITYLNCLEMYNGRYVTEQRAIELIETYKYQLWLDELLERFPEGTRVGNLIRDNILKEAR